MSDIEIEIDGKVLTTKPNRTVIQVADEAGIYIPRFCYHKHLSIAANCRMCLVEVEKSPKALPACATPVTSGMKVFTRSTKALAAQKAVMEFLLINHPLDCPICDQGGECELQDLSMGYGSPHSYYHEGKRSVKDQNIGPLVATDMTRCIQCTRCVRFGDEIAGLRELGAVNRGEHLEIRTYVGEMLHSEVSGNIIDLCPVGALTSKPFRFRARAWELEQFASIAAHDCIGANIYVHARRGTVMRVVARENTEINETWISDRDRFSYQGLYHEDRISTPLQRVMQKWENIGWEQALTQAASKLQQIIAQYSADEIGVLVSPNATTEECYLIQKILRDFGGKHIDHRLRQIDPDLPIYHPGTPDLLNKIEDAQGIILIGGNPQREQPSLGLRIRKAAMKGAKVFAINMLDYTFHFSLMGKRIVAPHVFTLHLARLVKALMPDADIEVAVNAEDKAFAEKISAQKNIHILLGASALNHPEAALIHKLAQMLNTHLGGTLTLLTEGCNALGASLAGCIPYDGGLSANEMLAQKRKAYILFNVEPDTDLANPVQAIAALSEAEFVLALSVFKNPVLAQYAHILLPITPFTETAGTYVNVQGLWQSFQSVTLPKAESRPGWKVLRVLANFLNLEDYQYASSEEVLKAIPRSFAPLSWTSSATKQIVIKKNHIPLSRIGDIPMYSIDGLVRRAESLQAAQLVMDKDVISARIHPDTARTLHLREADMIFAKQKMGNIGLPVLFDTRVPEDAVFIPGALSATAGLSELFGLIEIIK